MIRAGRAGAILVTGVLLVLLSQLPGVAGGQGGSATPTDSGAGAAGPMRVVSRDVVQPSPAFRADTYAASTVYRVSVNGMPVPVTGYKSVAYGQFGFAGTARVTITMDRPVPAGLIVSPRSAKVKHTVSGNTITVTLNRPRQLAFHWGGPKGLTGAPGLPQKLFLFAEALEENPPVPGDGGVVDVATYRPDATGGRSSSAQLQAAVDALVTGQTLYIGPGTYTIDKALRVNRKRGVRIYLAPGALIRAGTTNFGWAGIYVTDSADVTVFGRGALDMNGTYLRPRYGFETPVQLRALNSTRTRFEGLLLRDAPEINVYADASPYTQVDGVKVIADLEQCNTDGFDFVDGSDHSSVRDAFVYNTDDGVALGWEGSLTGVNVVGLITWTTNCGAAIKQDAPKGDYAGQTLTDMTFENVDQIYGGRMFAMAPESHGFRGYHLKGVRNEDFRHRILDITCESGSTGCSIKDVALVNVDAPRAGDPDRLYESAWRICGSGPDQTVDGLTFRGVRIAGVPQSSLAELTSAAPLDVTDRDGGCAGTTFTSNWSFHDGRRPVISIKGTDVHAGGAAGTATFTVTRTGTTTRPLTVPLEILGSARNGIDYVAVRDAVTIAAGQNKAAITIAPTPGAPTGSTVRLRLRNAPLSTAWVVGPASQATAVIGTS